MFDNIADLKVLNFFDIEINCYKTTSLEKLLNKKYLLPSLETILKEDSFAKVYMGWNEKALFFSMEVNKPFEKGSLNDFRKTDSIELFLDTRSLKTKGYINKYCHHFVFIAQSSSYLGKEVTTFSTQDMHKLAEPKDLKIKSFIKPKAYDMHIQIPSFCLTGYNPQEIKKLSFCYRINRAELPSQDFFVSSLEHKIEKSPHLWVEMQLI